MVHDILPHPYFIMQKGVKDSGCGLFQWFDAEESDKDEVIEKQQRKISKLHSQISDLQSEISDLHSQLNGALDNLNGTRRSLKFYKFISCVLLVFTLFVVWK